MKGQGTDWVHFKLKVVVVCKIAISNVRKSYWKSLIDRSLAEGKRGIDCAKTNLVILISRKPKNIFVHKLREVVYKRLHFKKCTFRKIHFQAGVVSKILSWTPTQSRYCRFVFLHFVFLSFYLCGNLWDIGVVSRLVLSRILLWTQTRSRYWWIIILSTCILLRTHQMLSKCWHF